MSFYVLFWSNLLRFIPFVQVRFEHEYFENERAHGWVVQADAPTHYFMMRFGMLLRCDGQSMGIFVDESRLAGMWSEREESGNYRQLHFTVNSADKDCAYYTDIHSSLTEYGVVHGERNLSPISIYSESPRIDVGALGVIVFPLVDDGCVDMTQWISSFGKDYIFRVKCRSTIWKYLLVGTGWPEGILRLIDVNEKVQFSDSRVEMLPGGRKAITFYSQSLIGLQEKPNLRFQLRSGDHSMERILVSRLPMASPVRMRRELVGGVMTAVSEIFINR